MREIGGGQVRLGRCKILFWAVGGWDGIYSA